MRALANTARVTVMDEDLLEQRIQFVDDQVMHDPVAKIGGKYFSFYRFVDDEGDRLTGLITAVIDIVAKFQQVCFIIDFKSQSVEGIALVDAAIEISFIKFSQFYEWLCVLLTIKQGKLPHSLYR